MTDPWLVQSTKQNLEPEIGNSIQNAREENLQFEDNFAASSANPQLDNAVPKNDLRSNSNEHRPLPDSASYLEGLERKLENIKKGSKLVQALAEKREDCWRTLLQDDSNTSNCVDNNNEIFELEAPISNGDSTVQEIYRHLQPMQPVTLGETVHIVQFDQLEQRRVELGEEATEETITPDK